MRFAHLYTPAQELVYLNVALNNLTAIDHLQRCESLQKLDLSVNFIDASGLSSMTTLQHNTGLRQLHLLGNPCTAWARHRQYVAGVLPQLESLVSPLASSGTEAITITAAAGFREPLACSQDGRPISGKDRLEAAQALPQLEDQLQQLIADAAHGLHHAEADVASAGGCV